MSQDYQRVVEYLRDLRQGPLQTVTDEIAQAAADYAALCNQANDRLRKCSSFLQQGLRSEAIHLAEDSPNLLDLVAALDLPDPQTWTEFCQNNGLAVPPLLQLDRAAQLNEAYAQDQPLEHLMSRHRLLALSRAPVRERLDVMRQIAQVDTTNEAWEKDIRVFEKARLKELPASFYTAVKHRDDPALTTLMNELTQQTWYEPIPVELSTAVADAFARMQRATCETELRKLVEPLRDAFAARSVQECAALVNRWKKIMTAHEVTSVSTELTDEIKPVIAFVTEEEKREEHLKRFRESCKTFGRMLDRDATDGELEAAYAKLKEFKEPIDDELAQRYVDKKAERQKAVERKHKLRLMTIGAAGVAMALVVIVVTVFVMHDREANKWASKINEAIVSRQLDVAESYYADLEKNHPSFLKNNSVAAAIAKMKDLQGLKATDEGLLNGLVLRFEEAEKSAKPVAENPNASIDEMLLSAAGLQAALDQKEKDGDLTWVDTDKKWANGAIRLQTLLTGLQARASTKVKEEVAQATEKIGALHITAGSLAEASAQLEKIKSRMSTLRTASGLDDETRASVAGVLVMIDQRRQSMESMHDVANALERVRQQAKNPDELGKALAAFVQRYPNDPRSPEFVQAAARLPLAKAVDAWRDVVSQWGGQMAPPNADKALKRIDAITAYLAAYPESPMGMPAYTYADYAKRAAEALAEKGTWQVAFTDICNTPLLADLALMKTSDGQQYYVMGDIHLTPRKINNQVTITFEAIDVNDITKRVLVQVEPPVKVTTDRPIRLPQAKLIAELTDEVKLVRDTDWDTWGIDLVERIRNSSDMDIVVRAILIQQSLKTEDVVAGWALGETYTRTMNEFARQQPEQLHWYDPEKISDRTRKALKDTIEAIPAAATVKKLLAAQKATLFKAVAFDVVAMGVAMKDDDGHWMIAAQSGALANGNTAWTIAPGTAAAAPAPTPAPATAAAPADAAAAAPAAAATAAAPGLAPPANPGLLIQLGVVVNGKFVLTESALRNVPQGSIVYVTRP